MAVNTDKKDSEDSKQYQFCSLIDLYNAVPFGHLIIDLRSADAFTKCHIQTAKNIAYSDGSSEEQLKQFESDFKDIMDRKLPGKSQKKVYFYCDLDWNVKKSESPNKLFDNIFAILSNHNQEMLVLKDKVSNFLEQFPFYCVSSNENKNDNNNNGKAFIKYPNAIIENKLYLGTGNQATNDEIVKNLGITHIVNATVHIEMAFEFDETKEIKQDEKENELFVKYLNIAIEDDNNDENGNKLYQYFDDSIKFIDNALNNDSNRVLIHCEMGVSRSGTITILYVMHALKYSLVDAYLYVQSKREIVHPNDSFLQQLGKYEKQLYNGKTTVDSASLKNLREKMSQSKVTNMHKALGQVFGGGKDAPTGLDLLKLRKEKKKKKKNKANIDDANKPH